MSGLRTADVAIVGGGIAGVGLAAALAGRCRIVLLEREAQPGSHASGRSAAVFVPNYGDGPIRALTAAGADALRYPDPALWPTPVLKPRGLLRLVTEAGLDGYRRQMADAVGEVVDLSPSQAAQRFPLLRPERFVAASWEEDVHDIDVAALLQGWLRIARHAGIEVVTDAEVTGLARRGGIWRIGSTKGAVEAPVVVSAAGAWADRLAEAAGLPPIGLTACRRSMAVAQLEADMTGSAGWPFVVTFPLGWYAKPDVGRLLVSPGEEEPVEPHDAFAEDMTIAEALYRFEQDTTVTVRRVEATWAGLRTFAPDHRPVVGFDPLAEGFFWLAGQGGFGVQTAPALSAHAAALLLGEESPVPALAAGLVPDRLRRWRP